MSYLTDEQLRFYTENGYLIVRGLVPQSVLAPLRAALMSIVNGDDENIRRRFPVTWKDGTKILKIDRVFKASEVIQDFLATAKLPEVAAKLMGTQEVRLFYDQLIYKEPSIGGAVPCHQDYDYWRHVSTDNLTTGWTALGRSTVENGCMYVVPGSHKWGLVDCMSFRILKNPDPEALINDCLSEEQQNEVQKVPLLLEPGDVSFHHALTIHCSYPNTSDQARLGYIHHYLPGEARYVASNDIQKHHEIAVEDGEVISGQNFPMLWPRVLITQ